MNIYEDILQLVQTHWWLMMLIQDQSQQLQKGRSEKLQKSSNVPKQCFLLQAEAVHC